MGHRPISAPASSQGVYLDVGCLSHRQVSISLPGVSLGMGYQPQHESQEM
jgi:hypothetical protein